MRSKSVAVLRGGPSSEYEVSLQTGAQVLLALKALGYRTRDIIISKRGEWLEYGMVRQPEQLLRAVDVAFIALHGNFGEDGIVQRICERMSVPFTGSDSFASRIAFNKAITKDRLRDLPIKMPKGCALYQRDLENLTTVVKDLYNELGEDFVVKPTHDGSSHGIHIASGKDSLAAALMTTLKNYDSCLVEERIVGTEATCGILQDFRQEEVYNLPTVEIVPPNDADHFSAVVKYNGATAEICPGRFSFGVKGALAEAASLVHKTLGLDQYSRSDFIVRDGDAYFLEVNTLPGLTEQSLYPKAANAVGLEFMRLVEHLVETAKVRNRY